MQRRRKTRRRRERREPIDRRRARVKLPRTLPSNGAFVAGSLFGRFLPAWGWRFVSKKGRTQPALDLPYSVLLRPFRSMSRDLFSHFWVAPALWQFGQSVFPVDRHAGAFSSRPGYVFPREPAWKRNAFGFDRLLAEDQWLPAVEALVQRASLIVVDLTAITPGVGQELEAIARSDALGRTIGICEHGAAAQDVPQQLRTAFRHAASQAIRYDTADDASLHPFWRELVARAARILQVPSAQVSHPEPPARFYLHRKALVQMFRQGVR
jgi:hypothetical protein